MKRTVFFCVFCFLLLCGCDDEPNKRVNTLTLDYSHKLTDLTVRFPTLMWNPGYILIYPSSISSSTYHLEFALRKIPSRGEKIVFSAPQNISLSSAMWDEKPLYLNPGFTGTLTITPMEEENTYLVVIDGTIRDNEIGVASTIKGSNICISKTPIVIPE